MELQILHWFESLHNPILNPIMYLLTVLGDHGIFWILLTIAMLFVLPKRWRKVGLTMMFALLLSLLFCNGVMKNLWQRVRPFNVDTTFENLYGVFNSIHDWSFPSGHTSASFAAATAFFLWDKKKGKWALVLAALISVSRLYLTVHYPTDVLASLILGILYGAFAFWLVKKWLKKSSRMDAVFAQGASYKNLFAGKADKQ